MDKEELNRSLEIPEQLEEMENDIAKLKYNIDSLEFRLQNLMSEDTVQSNPPQERPDCSSELGSRIQFNSSKLKQLNYYVVSILRKLEI